MVGPAAPKLPDAERGRVLERPDGFYWLDEPAGKEYGPFPTLLAATQDMQGANNGDFGEGESLDEAESEIGITGWIDPDTGQPAEEKTPRVPEE